MLWYGMEILVSEDNDYTIFTKEKNQGKQDHSQQKLMFI